MKRNNPILLDCTFRDGGYYNSWDFDLEMINDYLKAVSAISIEFVELGFRVLNSNGFKGSCAYTKDSFLRGLDIPANLKLGVMVNAGEILKQSIPVEKTMSNLFCPAIKSPLSFVRIACHMHEFERALPAVDWLKDNGYIVTVNLMQVADRKKEEIIKVGQLSEQSPLDVLYFADSMGSMDPEQTSEIISYLRCFYNGPIGIHTHDNMGRALSNSLRAVAEGVTWIDGTITGMGRGPGNAKTEYLSIELCKNGNTELNLSPLLSLIEKYFKPLQAKYDWGTNSYYYLAGKYGIHPSFIQEMLSDSRYRVEDRLAVIEHLRETGGKRFSIDSLEAGRHFYTGDPVGTWSPYDFIKEKEVLIIGAGPSSKKHAVALESYIQAHSPVVLALNTQLSIKEKLIDIRAASHPVRLLADYAIHLTLPQPLVTPASMLPVSLKASLEKKELLDFGISIKKDCFELGKTYCILPNSLVIAYALAIASIGKAPRVLLAGFDGYGADDPRTVEMDSFWERYRKVDGASPILTITPSRYKLDSTSVYSMI